MRQLVVPVIRPNHNLRRVWLGVAAALVTHYATAAPRDYTLPVFQGDRGGVGLLQTPTARMAPTGRLSFTLDQVDPYTNYAFSVQPLDWLEFGIRYTQIGNRNFTASDGELDFLDKGFKFKLALVDERRFVPAVALGLQDIGGTGQFGGEYLVANKRWYNLDFSVGLGWGYLGSRGDFANPFGVLGERYDDRINRRSANGGEFNFKELFTGRPSLFGGVQYHTPFEPLTLQLEYDGNDYQSEPLDNPQEQDSPINVGLRYQAGDNVVLSAAWERGNTAMLGATLQLNLADITQIKNDPPPVPPKATPNAQARDWSSVADTLESNAGISTSKIVRRGRSLYITGQSTRYRDVGQAELRANRILHNAADPAVETFRYRLTEGGMAMREDSLPRAPLPHEPLLTSPLSSFSDFDYRHDVVSRAADAQAPSANDEVLYDSLGDRFSWSLTPDLAQNFGGPDGYLYKVLARLDAGFRTDRHGFFTGTLGYSVFDNLDKFDTPGSSQLPRVRSFIGQYLDQTDLGIYNLQYTRTARLSDNWFGMAYAGLLEQMFAGGGGQVLYRPFNSRLAFGVDAAWVRQREFDTQFGLRDYSTWTGLATMYYDTGFKDILAKVSAGRYLAKDLGATLDVSREFDSGVRLGAFATMTDAGDKFGEGSFDKGVYLSIPLDLFFTESSRRRASVTYRPLTRDGGARLGHRFDLYNMTQARNLDNYWQGFDGGAYR